MGKIIAIANYKGGVAKTTTTANLGAILSTMGKKVLLIDLDSQASLTDYFLPERPEKSIYNALVDEEPLPITQTEDGLSIVPSSFKMADVETRIADNLDRVELLQILLEPLRESYDYILIDCPPSLGLITLNALVAARDLYIPLTAETLPARGLQAMTGAVDRVRKRKNPSLSLSGIIICRWAGRKINKEIEKSLRTHYGALLFKTKIRENISIAEAPTFHEDVYKYAPASHGAEDYMALAKEVIKRMEGGR